MSKDDLSARLLVTFLQELEEQAQELNSGLLALEQQTANAETIRTLFRSAHTIKGAARVAGAPAIEEACHALESVFALLRDGRIDLDGGAYSLLFATVDALAEAGELLRRGEPLDGASLTALLPRLEELADRSADGAVVTPVLRDLRPAPVPQPPAVPTVAPAPPPAVPPRAERATAGNADAGRADAERAGGAREPADELVRVRADRLDALLSAVGELMVATGRIVERNGRRDEDTRRLDLATDVVADVVHHLRLRPFADVCEGLPRAVRDIAAADGKQVRLELSGEEVEADRMVVDALREPLLHLVRNAVDHGIEAPDERRRQHKDATGVVQVAAVLEGGRLQVTVADDGRGLDEGALRDLVRARTGRTPESRAEVAEALLAGGVTTRGTATAISGRGVGVDLVRSAMERIGGTLDVEWEAGRGTRFTLECPPSPTSIRALLFRTGAHVFALPTLQVERLRRLRGDQVRYVEGRAMLPTSAGPIPIHSLAALLGPPLEDRPLDGAVPLIILGAGGRRAGIIVDEVLDEDEIVVRPLDVDTRAVPWATGAAVLPSGRVAMVLATATLLGRSSRSGTGVAPAFSAPAAARRRVLVADDSITTRTLEQSVLESAGYEVITAVNGEDAWRRLEQDGADLLVADVEMPRMDGIALCRRIRSSSRFAELPIVLVTGLGSDEDRARGLEAGADAYIAKSSFDQADLIDTVQQLTGGK